MIFKSISGKHEKGSLKNILRNLLHNYSVIDYVSDFCCTQKRKENRNVFYRCLFVILTRNPAAMLFWGYSFFKFFVVKYSRMIVIFVC
jgi:hypothetical protein